MPFDLENWKHRNAANFKKAESNALMDSGWSARVADECMRMDLMLLLELTVALAETETKPEDFFDRPDLVKVQEAARFATKPIVEFGR